MTSAQSMLDRKGLWIGILTAIMAVTAGCQVPPDLLSPQVLLSPYDSTNGEVLWGIVPLRNETGTSVADVYAITDAVIAAASQIQGIRTVPLNRTLEAMRSLEITSVDDPGQLEKLARAMGVDGLIVGSITAYDPYEPPKLGLSLALYGQPGRLKPGQMDALDIQRLAYQPTDYEFFPNTGFSSAPASVVSEYLDARNHAVQMRLRDYATGRHDRKSARGWRSYLASMHLYTEFAAWQTVGQLVHHEWIRLARSGRGAG